MKVEQQIWCLVSHRVERYGQVLVILYKILLMSRSAAFMMT